MSSLRNAVKRITHKERQQPQARAHLGFLEKKQDYRVRAKDYHRKEQRIQHMREQASFRNPDEFYFGMTRSQVNAESGKHEKTKQAKQREFEQQVGLETVRIMKDQDLGFIRMQRQKDLAQVEKMQSSLHRLDEAVDDDTRSNKKRKHTIFVETQQEADTFDVAKHFDTVEEMAGRAYNRRRIADLHKSALEQVEHEYEDDNNQDPSQDTSNSKTKTVTKQQLATASKRAKKASKAIAKARKQSYKLLEARKLRIKAMERAEAHLVTEKLVQSKGAQRRKIAPAKDGQPAQYKWRRKRNR